MWVISPRGHPILPMIAQVEWCPADIPSTLVLHHVIIPVVNGRIFEPDVVRRHRLRVNRV